MGAVVVVWAFFMYFVGFYHCFFSPIILFFDVTNLLRIILQETFVIQDAILYKSGEVILADYSLTLPQNYQVNVKTIKTSSSSSIGTVNLWNNENKALGFGSFNNNQYDYGLEYYDGIDWSYANRFSLDNNVEYDWIYKYENRVASITVNGITKTLSRPHSVVKIDVGLSNFPNLKFKDLIIKAL